MLAPDPKAKDEVQKLLNVLVQDDLSPVEIAQLLDQAGFRTTTSHNALGRHLPYGALQGPSRVIGSLYALAGLYCYGEFLYRTANEFKGFTEHAGLRVMRYPNDPKDPGELQMLFKPGVPEGGWADPDVLERFASIATARCREQVAAGAKAPRPLDAYILAESADATFHAQMLTPTVSGMAALGVEPAIAPRSKKKMSLFAGRTWADDTYVYELMLNNSEHYKLIRQRMHDDHDTGYEDADGHEGTNDLGALDAAIDDGMWQ
jgi:hypothetical protein